MAEKEWHTAHKSRVLITLNHATPTHFIHPAHWVHYGDASIISCMLCSTMNEGCTTPDGQMLLVYQDKWCGIGIGSIDKNAGSSLGI
jgi:hypothetical protein